jgi:peptidoglycan/xylan/chitin deacetylase (PgdA/CDA1 family)
MSRTGLKKVWEAAQWLKYRVRSGALILMYHRVTNLPNDPHLVAVTPKHFAEQMEVIRSYYMSIRLQQLVQTLRDGNAPARAVIVTFDDGYADNLHEAMPLLERYDIPATVFVTAGQVGSQREFWWDELDRLLLQPGILPAKLRLNVNGNTFEPQLGEASTYTEQDYRRDRGWHIARQDNPGPRQLLFRKLLAAMSTLPGGERDKVIDELLAWAGAAPSARPTHRALTIDELRQLQKCALMEVAAHTMTHPKLADIPAAQQRTEIQQSKKVLEAMLNRPVTSFAFPFGSSALETVAMVRDEGFVCACSTRSDVVFRGADRFLLPRVIVRDWDGERFGRFLRWWMGG